MAENLKIASVNNPATDAENALAPVVQMPAAQKPKPESDFPFSVTVGDVYEGPLDLLLDLIRKQDIDIYDIPIARITAQYLTYVEKLRELDVNVAAEFHLHGGGADPHQVEDAAAARSRGGFGRAGRSRGRNW